MAAATPPPLTLAATLDAVATTTPDAPALVERSGDGTRTLTFRELQDASARAAAELAARGTRRGDVVGVWLPNQLEAVVVEFALASLGAASMGINTRYGAHELGHLLATGRPVGVVVPGDFLGLDFAGRLHGALGSATAAAPDLVPPWVMVTGERSGGTGELDVGGSAWRLGESGDPAPARRMGEPGDVLNYFTTSGSTGVPKLAGHDQASVVEHARNIALVLEMAPGDVMLGVLPLSGVFGFNPTMAMLSAGGTCLLMPAFDADAAVADMAAFGVTHVIGGDDMFSRLMQAWEKSRVALPAFRRGGSSDYSGSAATVMEWAEREVGATVSGLYGSSELYALTAIWPADLPLEQRQIGGGVPISEAIEVRVVEPDSGAPRAATEVGELQFRGYNVLREYLGNAQATSEAFTADGWFQSGDLGFMTGDGSAFVYVCRAGDALRLRGYLVEPAEIEHFLMSHPAVDVAKVVGVRPGGGAEQAVAYVTLRAGEAADPDQLRAYCRSELAAYKVPSIVNVIDEFPVTTGPNGTKIRAAELRRWAERQLEQAGG
jgi:acyl-CoA synthetase (AMP-forming)/AMP-acid ligase II